MSRIRVMRLYPEKGSSLYVRVRVHPTKKSMRERHREINNLGLTKSEEWDPSTAAFCIPWVEFRLVGHWRRRAPCVAEVNFWSKSLGTTVVTHEFFHATMAFARRAGIFPAMLWGEQSGVTDLEERLAYAHGELCRQFVDRAYSRGIYS